MKIHWGAVFTEESMGNAYGYYVHNSTLLEYTAKIAEITPDAKDAVIIISPEQFQPIEGKRNWLFTMFEGNTLPQIYVDSIKRADFLLTPSTWVKGLFEQYYPKEKIFVVNHGVRTDFKYKTRKYPTNKPFRYLWVGAPNPRKGFEEVMVVWDQAGFKNDPRVELYLKTTRVGKLEKRGNVILDGRNIPREELIQIYHDSHCFLFPTRGEGFGLTLAEAMATGLPCISPYYSGVTDFFDDTVGLTISHELKPGRVKFVGAPDSEYETLIAMPNPDELAMAMIAVRKKYESALLLGWQASRRIKERFTWENSAKTLVNVIQNN